MSQVAKVVYDEKVQLWRIRDGRNGKVVLTGNYKAVDKGGQRTELEAFRILKEYLSRRPKKS